jgi:hypothetical protein
LTTWRKQLRHPQKRCFDYARIVDVKILLKSLIVWLLLLAVPFQGFASATMLFCAPIQTPAAVTTAAGHDHHAMSMGQGAEHHHDANAKAASHHDGSKCNSCASCCFGASMPPSQTSRLPVETQHFAAIPFKSGAVPTVDLALPERPPQASLT